MTINILWFPFSTTTMLNATYSLPSQYPLHLSTLYHSNSKWEEEGRVRGKRRVVWRRSVATCSDFSYILGDVIPFTPLIFKGPITCCTKVPSSILNLFFFTSCSLFLYSFPFSSSSSILPHFFVYTTSLKSACRHQNLIAFINWYANREGEDSINETCRSHI